MKKEIEESFAKFNLTWNDVKNKLIESGLTDIANEISDCIRIPSKPYPLQIVSFAMSSLILKNVKNVLEIGTSAGKSAFALSRLFPKSMIYTIDIGEPDPNYSISYKGIQEGLSTEERRLAFEKNTMAENIKFIESNSFFLPSLDLPEKFELIFVDGDHNFPQVAGDIMFAYSRIRSGGFLFMHDYNMPEKFANDVKETVDWVEARIKEKVIFLLGNTRPSIGKMALIVKADGGEG